MKRITTLALLGALAAGPAMADDTQERAAASRETVKEFFGTLKGELVKALEGGGPVAAIEVCHQKAPAIAKEISDKKGWRVARTSLKLRNPANAPDAWEEAVLKKFDERLAAGEDPQQIEQFAVVEAGGKKAFRYMKAIPTAEKPCLVCHGENVPAPVAAALDKLYPQDRARGYKAGMIRGAFTITQPLK